MVHAIAVERIVGEVRAEQQAALLAAAFGGKPEWPDVDARIDEFEQWLTAEPKHIDADELELRHALGLRGTGG